MIRHQICQICIFNDAFTTFDENDYHKPNHIKYFGYNHVINPNCYNIIDTCYDCLLENIYNCNLELKYQLLNEFKFNVHIKKIQKWWINNLYNINTTVGKSFIYKHLSNKTQLFFNIKKMT
jgi:hypothetical protein